MRIAILISVILFSMVTYGSDFKERNRSEKYYKSSQRCLDLVAAAFSGSNLENSHDETERIIPLRDGQLAHIQDGKMTVFNSSGSNEVKGLSCSMDREKKVGDFLERMFVRRGDSLMKNSSGRVEDLGYFRRQLNVCAEHFPEIAALRSRFGATEEASDSDGSAKPVR